MRVLLVDHDSEGLETIARAIRGVLELDCVTSKGDALLLLRQNAYDVLIACERAVDGSGLDLLGRTTRTAVPLKRIFAAAPERLQLLGPRLAPFKVQRTINYPIDLEELWLAIAQVTGGPNDETDGTIERVVLDERGYPANGTSQRAPIPPRPQTSLGGGRAAPQLHAVSAPAIGVASNGARAAAARMVQPAPEPPLRAPPPPRAPPVRQHSPAPPARAAAPQMRSAAPPMQQIPPMHMAPPQSASSSRDELPGWIPEAPNAEDFEQVAAQARLGVQRKVVDEASRRKRQRLLTACGIAVVVAGALVFLIEKFYDPEGWARKQAIAAEVSRMAEQQKVTDDLTLIEIDIENAITNNDLDTARRELATLAEKSPNHGRLEFLQTSIDRAEELQKFAAQGQTTAPVQSVAPRAPAARPRTTERVAERAKAKVPERAAARTPERRAAPRQVRETPTNSASRKSRVYGAPISEPPLKSTIALDAPINSPPTTDTIRRDNNFGGRTVEASDSTTGQISAAPQNSVAPTSVSAAASMPAPAPRAPVDVTPARIVKRVTPVVTGDVPRKTSGNVIVKFDISDAGRVSNVEVLESSPPGVFDDSALSAVRKWVYEPRRENGVPVASQAKARLVFEPTN